MSNDLPRSVWIVESVHTVKHHLIRPLKIIILKQFRKLDKEIEKILLDVGLTPPWR